LTPLLYCLVFKTAFICLVWFSAYHVPEKMSLQVSFKVRVLLPLLVNRLPLYSVLRLRCIGILLMSTDEMMLVPLLAARVTFVFH